MHFHKIVCSLNRLRIRSTCDVIRYIAYISHPSDLRCVRNFEKPNADTQIFTLFALKFSEAYMFGKKKKERGKS